MPTLAFEDFVPGTVSTYGAYRVTREEIVAFASRFDAQPMHLDEAAAATTMLGGLAASGWHSCAMMMRLFADNVLMGSTGMGAPGVDEVKWLRPVRPGDVLSVRQTILDVRPSSRRTDRGYVRLRLELLNQDGACVLHQENSVIFGRRNQGDTA